MLNIYTGRNRLLARALTECVRQSNGETELIVVPGQLTLATEQLLLGELGLKGSFRIQVLTADRLCARIFDAAGQPDGARIDDRGRVMLVRSAVRLAEENLGIYRGAELRRGFPERAAKQLEHFRQARIQPETLRECAEKMHGSARMKLNDLSYILEAYESLIEGKYLDGESEFLSATARAGEAEFLGECNVWFYGFDMMPPTMHGLIAAVALKSKATSVFLPLENDTEAADYGAFQPLKNEMDQLFGAAASYGCQAQRIEICEAEEADEILVREGTQMPVRGTKRKPALRHLEHGLFAFPAERMNENTASVQLTLLRNPQEECRFAAALARRLVAKYGWRWRDVSVFMRDPAGYAPLLKSAFAEYGVPIFLSSSRTAARHDAAEYLITALTVIEKNYPPEDMFALMNTGLSALDECESERFTNYAIRYGIRGTRFTRTLTRGQEAEIAQMEPLRVRLMEPLQSLRENMRAAKGLNDQLLALVRFLEDSQAYAKSEAKIQALCENGMRETAGEEAQVWNRIMGALDQMHALMGDKKLSLREIRDTLNESLSAAVIKPLPQSADAVHAQSIEQSCAGETKAMILVGMNDRASGGENGLLTPSQKKTLANFAHVYLGPDDADLTRMRRYYLKAAFGMVTDYVSVSCPLSGLDGAGQQPSAVFDLIRALYPNVVIRGGVSGDESIERMLHGAPKAAVSLAATALSDEGEGKPMTAIDRAALAGLQKSESEDAKIGIRRLSAALNRNAAADALSPAVARELYGVIHTQSITRLERFASCPFSYYIQYGIKPEKVQPYELCAADEGSFFHEAVHEFLLRSMKDLNSLDAEAAQMRMDAVSDTLLEAMRNSGPLGDSAVALAEQRRLKATMRCVAVALAEHMHSSRFHAHALEQSFGPEDGAKAIRLSEGCVLEGRIDRIDIWNEQKKYLRIIDFKRGGKEFSLSQVYHGLSLQLPIYLSAALSRGDALSAGVFYFPLDEGILTTQSTDSTEIEATRKKQMRMQGLLPSDEEVLKAFSPQLDTVVKVRLTSEGKLYSNAFAANQSDYRAMMECAVRRADEDIRGIRNGVCAASPARIESLNPCTYCDYKTACLFDDRLDAQHIRRLDRLSAEMAMLKMKTEQTEAEKGQEND